MAILCGISESGMSLYDIPDAELSKYQLNSRWMSEEDRAKMFPDKEPTKDDAQVVIPTAAAGGDVQGFGTNDICCDVWSDGSYICWVC